MKAGVVLLILGCGIRNIIRKKEEYFIVIKGPILQEDIKILNVYFSNSRSSKTHKAKTETAI